MSGQTIAILAVWITVGFVLIRSTYHSDASHHDKWIIRLQVILFAIAFSLWGENTELQIDRYFNDYPVTLFIKTLSLLSVSVLYHDMLKSIRQASSPLRILDYLGVFIPIIATLAFTFYVVTGIPDRQSLRFIVIGFRDATICFFSIAHFIPGSWWMYKQESIPAMKVKALCMSACFTCFCITAIGSISAAGLAIANLEGAYSVSTALQPFIYIAIILFVLQLTPHRWFSWLIQSGRLRDYYRLKHLENYIANYAYMPDMPQIPWYDLLKASQLELAVYRSLIMILDYYPLLDKQGKAGFVYQQLAQHSEEAKDYAQLIRQIVKIRL